MTPKSKPEILLSHDAWDEFKKLPGNIRRQLIPLIDNLDSKPRPANSKLLIKDNEGRELRRLRAGHWRLIYLLIKNQPLIVGIRRRPPYDYEDIQQLLQEE